MSIAKSSRISLTAFFYSIRINDQWRIVFKFENVVAENVRIADIRIRLIDYHKADTRKNCEAILCGRCSQLARTRTHSDNGSTLRKHRPSDSWRCCIQPAMLRSHSDNGSISWHNMSACTVSPGSGRGQRSRIRQAPSSPHRRNRSRIFQGSF